MNIFENIFITNGITINQFLLCLICSLFVGFIIAAMDTLRQNVHSRSFVATIALLPAIVSIVILVVGGNIGAGIAVVGAFSLVRFRSIPGTAEEISIIFLAMASGLLIGAGYLGYAVLFVLIVGGISLVLTRIGYKLNENPKEQILKITIPEDIDYSAEIETIIKDYTLSQKLISMRTINMGSMFRLTYSITMDPHADPKKMIDSIRERNGNLEVILTCEIQEERGL